MWRNKIVQPFRTFEETHMSIARFSVAASLPFLAAVFLLSAALEPRSSYGQATSHTDSEWIRPHKRSDPLIWGRKDGIVLGIPSRGGLPGAADSSA